jgi:O-glycosyl hydrolase
MEIKIKSPQRPLVWLLSLFLISSCQSQVKEKSESERVEVTTKNQRIWGFQETTFPQIHSNLHGMVREFVRSMYQDKKATIGLEQIRMVLYVMTEKHWRTWILGKVKRVFR